MERTPNKDQQRVINDCTHNVILYASAGTGKTFTVAQKVKKIIESGLARPEEILCLTFTIKACEEMRADILSYDEGAEGVEVSTIHSFCYKLVKEEARRVSDNYVEPVICDEVDQEEILQKLIPEQIAMLRMEEYVQRNGIGKSLKELFACDTFYLAEGALPADHRRMSPREADAFSRLRHPDFFWKITSHDPPYFLSPKGVLSQKEGEDRIKEDAVFSCPECKKRQTQSGNFCSECGFDLRTYVTPVQYALGRHGGYRNAVSLIKHCRAEYGFNSRNEEGDYSATFERLKRSNPEVLERAFRYVDRKAEAVDRELLNDMQSFGGRVLAAYGNYLRASNRLDFDDLIIEARNFLSHPEIRGRWQERYKFIIVDEMQDTSELEYDLLKRLFPRARVMMCGDFFQTIYEWRGSNPRAVLDDYIKAFGAKVYMLSENYRSTRLLTLASFGYLKNTYPREVGVFCPEYISIAGREEGEPIRFVECDYPPDREMAEAAFIFRYLIKHHSGNPADVCVMARSNNYINKLWLQFNKFNDSLPEEMRLHFFTVDKDYKFFKTPIVRDVLAFWALLINPSDAVAMERIAEKYIYGVGAATVRAVGEMNGAGLSLASFLEEDTYSDGDPFRTLIDAVNAKGVVVYDTETTGLDTASDGIIQIAAMRMDRRGDSVEEFKRFVIPIAEISEGALGTHGYSLDYIKANGGICAEQALKEFSAFVKGAVLVGHNSAKFDRAIVNRQLSECGLPPLDIKGEYDTLSIAKLLFPELKNHKLDTLCQAFGIVNERAHDAFADVGATAKVLSHFVTQILELQGEKRERAVKRYKNRFAAFYGQYREMKELLAKGDMHGLNDYIKREFRLLDRYGKELEIYSLDVLNSLAEERKDERGSPELAVRDLLAGAALAGSEMDVLIKKSDKIPIITVHQSKGCEFDTVILAGADNFTFPNFSAVKENREEEEKRVFYVAISRAKNKLVMTCRKGGPTGSRKPSPYVFNIPRQYIEWYFFDGKTTVKRG